MTAQHAAAPGAVPAVPRSARPSRAPGRVTTLVIMAATGVLILGAAFLANRQADASGLTPVNLGGTPNGPAPIVDQAAPPLTAKLADGTAFDLASLKGKVVWLTFGASWCQPCRAENADVLASYEAFKAKGVVVVQVFMDEDATAVKDYAARVGLTYLQVPDPAGQLSTDYRILGIPTHFFIDREGVLRQLKVGTLNRDAMTQVLTELAG
jgi:cytochrome c biogenesis protein CcmG, thiol:disulfide interchange protein DsbE